jgi:hypothetical protein
MTHPEVAIGIPAVVVTATPKAKARYAAALDPPYEGPLTLAQAVRQGKYTRIEALKWVNHWVNHGGNKILAARMVEGL